jgi:SAM-dependent methyltransferase
MTNQSSEPDFDALYRDEQLAEGLPAATPWDIGGPQPVVQQLVAYGGLRGEVLDPGTGPGHHAIYYAANGYSVTGIDGSATAIDRATHNAERAGVAVDFQVADATQLDGLDNRFDTVVDSAFYHVFFGDEDTQTQYAHALHRATKPGARLFMFEFGGHNVNGIQIEGLPEDNFRRVLSAAQWRIDHLGTATYQANYAPETFASMGAQAETNPRLQEMLAALQQQLRVIGPLLENHRIHIPMWTVTATRID